MSGSTAFVYPPDVGNAWSLVAYYTIFLVVQFGLTFPYLRRWNILIFLGLIIFLILEILGSVAYVKLHYSPVTGVWYNVWLFTLSAAPTFFISSINLCVQRLLHEMNHVPKMFNLLISSPRIYTICCLGVDFVALLLTIIGAAYVGAKSSDSPATSKPGFDLMTAGMAIQCCNIFTMLIVGFGITKSFMGHRPAKVSVPITNAANASMPDKQSAVACSLQRPRSFGAFLICLLATGVLVLARTIIRVIDLAGGVRGPLEAPVLVNVESILLFVAILLVTALHPAINLRSSISGTSSE